MHLQFDVTCQAQQTQQKNHGSLTMERNHVTLINRRFNIHVYIDHLSDPVGDRARHFV